MWIIKTFKSEKSMNEFLAKNANKIQYDIIFIENFRYAIEYRKLRRVY